MVIEPSNNFEIIYYEWMLGDDGQGCRSGDSACMAQVQSQPNIECGLSYLLILSLIHRVFSGHYREACMKIH